MAGREADNKCGVGWGGFDPASRKSGVWGRAGAPRQNTISANFMGTNNELIAKSL